jgi:AcrR family transcriptional regulator
VTRNFWQPYFSEHAVDTLSDMADDPADAAPDQLAEGLRERKKRLTRQLLSDTATMLFLERGFDGFKITEVAEACGVSEKTVYNYFPTKESLILDREEDMAAAIRHALGPDSGTRSPVDAIVEVLVSERRHMREGLVELGGEEAGLTMFRRFMTAIDETPSLRAALGESTERMAQLAATCLAERAGVSPHDPEPMIVGRALIGLWEVQRAALRRDAESDQSAADVYARTEDEVRRAARLIDTGLWSFSVMVAGGGSREQMRAASEAAQNAGRQIATALRQARKLWADMQSHHSGSHDGEESWSAGWGDWAMNAGDASSRDQRQQWREAQREQVQRWRESQREQAQTWREAAQAFKQEQRESAQRLKEELKQSHRAHQDDLRNARRDHGPGT